MSLKTRLIKVEEAELRGRVEQLALEQGVDAESLMADGRRIAARLRVLKLTHPLKVVDGMVDIEPHLRILAEEEGLDPEELLEEARRIDA